MKYNLDNIKKTQEVQQPTTSSNKDQQEKLKYFKPQMGKNNIRFLPYMSLNETPIETILFYDNKKIGTQYRVVSPRTFGERDILAEAFDTIRRQKGPEAWNVAKNLKAQEKCFAFVIDRDHEELGPQLWELKPEHRNEIFGKMLEDDHVDNDLFDAKSGHDWTVTVKPKMDADGKPQMFNGYPVKTFSFSVRAKSTPLSTDKEQAAKWLDSVPNIAEFYKARMPTEEQQQEILENYLASKQDHEPESTATGNNASSTDDDGVDAETKAKLDEAFAGF